MTHNGQKQHDWPPRASGCAGRGRPRVLQAAAPVVAGMRHFPVLTGWWVKGTLVLLSEAGWHQEHSTAQPWTCPPGQKEPWAGNQRPRSAGLKPQAGQPRLSTSQAVGVLAPGVGTVSLNYPTVKRVPQWDFLVPGAVVGWVLAMAANVWHEEQLSSAPCPAGCRVPSSPCALPRGLRTWSAPVNPVSRALRLARRRGQGQGLAAITGRDRVTSLGVSASQLKGTQCSGLPWKDKPCGPRPALQTVFTDLRLSCVNVSSVSVSTALTHSKET